MKARRVKGEGWERLARFVGDSQKHELRVGWPESAKYEDGTPVAYAAVISEFGVPERSIPARPFMRPTLKERRDFWRGQLKPLAKRVVVEQWPFHEALKVFGERVAGDIAKKISQIQDPPLTLTTLLLRKHKMQGGTVTGHTVGAAAKVVAKLPEEAKIAGVSKKPLIFTHLLFNSLTAQVVNRR